MSYNESTLTDDIHPGAFVTWGDVSLSDFTGDVEEFDIEQTSLFDARYVLSTQDRRPETRVVSSDVPEHPEWGDSVAFDIRVGTVDKVIVRLFETTNTAVETVMDFTQDTAAFHVETEDGGGDTPLQTGTFSDNAYRILIHPHEKGVDFNIFDSNGDTVLDDKGYRASDKIELSSNFSYSFGVENAADKVQWGHVSGITRGAEFVSSTSSIPHGVFANEEIPACVETFNVGDNAGTANQSIDASWYSDDDVGRTISIDGGDSGVLSTTFETNLRFVGNENIEVQVPGLLIYVSLSILDWRVNNRKLGAIVDWSEQEVGNRITPENTTPSDFISVDDCVFGQSPTLQPTVGDSLIGDPDWLSVPSVGDEFTIEYEKTYPFGTTDAAIRFGWGESGSEFQVSEQIVSGTTRFTLEHDSGNAEFIEFGSTVIENEGRIWVRWDEDEVRAEFYAGSLPVGELVLDLSDVDYSESGAIRLSSDGTGEVNYGYWSHVGEYEAWYQDCLDRLKNHLKSPYNPEGEVWDAILRALAKEICRYEKTLGEVDNVKFVETSGPETINRLASIFDIERQSGEPIDDYRARMKVALRRQIASGTIEEIAEVAEVLLDGVGRNDITIHEPFHLQPAFIMIEVDGDIDIGSFAEVVQSVTAAGVGVGIKIPDEEHSETLAISSEGTVKPDQEYPEVISIGDERNLNVMTVDPATWNNARWNVDTWQ